MTTPWEYEEAKLIAALAKGRNDMEANLEFCEKHGLKTVGEVHEFKLNGGVLPGAAKYSFTKGELQAIITAAGPRPRGRPISGLHLALSKWARNEWPQYLQAAKECGESDPKGAALDKMSATYEVPADTLSSWIWRRGKK
jgi:hypothetical protein